MICLEKFMEWLNDEIKDLTTSHDGKESEAIRIRAKLCEMDAHDKEIEDELGVICQRYCRFPEAYPERETDRMIEERCKDCIITRLTT